MGRVQRKTKRIKRMIIIGIICFDFDYYLGILYGCPIAVP